MATQVGQLSRVVTVEAFLIGLYSGAGGLVVGVGLAFAVILDATS